MATFIVQARAVGSADVSRCAGLAHATSVAAGVRIGMPPGKRPGARGGGKK
ncbi:MAG: hypothetical protein ACLQAR_05780 [Steroidobacteraceae bacterium]